MRNVQLDKRLSAYGDTLSRFSSVLSQLPTFSAPHVLDLGCGAAHCASAIRERWPDARILGLDRDQEALRDILNFVAPVQADLCALPMRMGQFGIVIMRHPDIDRGSASWQSAIRSVPLLLCNGGIVLVTCYSLAERDQIRRWLAPAEMSSVMQSITFEYKLVTLPDAAGHDRYVAAWCLTGE